MKSTNDNEIVVMRNTIRLLRLSRIFPNDEELDKPRKQRIMSTLMLCFCAYFPVGIFLHIVTNMQSK